MFARLCAIAIALVLIGSPPIMADTLYVDDDGSPGGDGTTWNSAFPDLQLALDAAKASGGTITEIHVAAGTYYPTAEYAPGDPRTACFQLINNLAVKGGYRGCPDGDCSGYAARRNIAEYQTILSGDLAGNDIFEEFPDGPSFAENSYHVLYHPKTLGLNETAILDGCTITGGNRNGGAGPKAGGGMFCEGSAPAIKDCIFAHNHANSYGGGVCCVESHTRLTGCTLQNNTSHYGAGLACLIHACPILSGCTIKGNDAFSNGGGISCDQQSRLAAEGCTISNNTAGEKGGGLFSGNASSPNLTNCSIDRNTAASGGAVYYAYAEDASLQGCALRFNTATGPGRCGGGIECYQSSPEITNCLIVGNIAQQTEEPYAGGAIFCEAFSYPRVTNCTVALNAAEAGGAALACINRSRPEFTNCIVYGNTPASVSHVAAEAVITYSNIQGGYEGPGNIDADPLFAFDQDLHLMPGSPCIDAGKNAPFMGFPTEDFEGGQRTLDGDGDTVEFIDMGAYEFNPNAPIIAVSQTEITMGLEQEEGSPFEIVLSIRNAGGGTLDWQITPHIAGLQATPESGTSTGQITDVLLTIDHAQWPDDQREGHLIVSSSNAPNSPRKVIVKLRDPTGLHVPADYPTIQEAIDAAVPGDIITIADGTYTGPGNRDLDFLGKPITVRSEHGPETCIIDCERQGRGVAFTSGETNDARLEGITIRGGYVVNGWGGGIRCRHSSPTIINCVITDNVSAGGYPYAGGGGIGVSWGAPEIRNCEILYNKGYYGGGIHLGSTSNVEIRGCLIQGNTAYQGGGIYDGSGYQISAITDCRILNNVARSHGGGIFLDDVISTRVANCLLAGNLAWRGAAIGSEVGLMAAISNCTIAYNRASGSSGAISFRDNGPVIENSILWGNYPRQIVSNNVYAHASVRFSNIQDGHEGEGNISQDPLFAFEGDCHLSPGSPCIDAGSNELAPELAEYDIDGNPRFHDGDADGSTTVDMGAHEFHTLHPALAVSTEFLERSVSVDDLSPTTATLQIRNSGGGTLNWLIDEDADWLTVDTPTGASSGEIDEVILTFDPTGMTLGTYQCVLTVAAPEAVNSARTVRLAMHIHRTLRVPSQYESIRAAVDEAESHDVVLIADGVYQTGGLASAVFGSEIEIRSENGPENCIIDCEGSVGAFAFLPEEEDESDPELMTVSTLPQCYLREQEPLFPHVRGPLLQGITVQNANNGVIEPDYSGAILCAGSNVTIRDCVIQDSVGLAGGGVYFRENALPTIEDCLITRCTAEAGAGIYSLGGAAIRRCEISYNSASSLAGGVYITSSWYHNSGGVIESCYIHDNVVTSETYPESAHGGGVCVYGHMDSPPLVTDSIIESNTASARGGGFYANGAGDVRRCVLRNNISSDSGGGIHARSGGIVLECIFEGNTSERSGGGLFSNSGLSAPMCACDFINNTAGENGGGFACGYNVRMQQCNFSGNVASQDGGAIHAEGDSLALTNSLITNNHAAANGGAIHFASGELSLANCTLSGNAAEIAGGALYQSEGSATITNTIFYGDAPEEFVLGTAEDDVTYSLVQGGYEGEGNINADPLFLDPEGPDDDPATWEDNDFRLAAGSPCIDAANNLAVPLDDCDLNGDGDRTERIPFDLAGFARFIDDTATTDTGIADPPDYSDIVDMGAYEHQPDRRRSKKLNRSLETHSRKEATRKPRPADIDRAGSRETTGTPGATGGSPASASHASDRTGASKRYRTTGGQLAIAITKD